MTQIITLNELLADQVGILKSGEVQFADAAWDIILAAGNENLEKALTARMERSVNRAGELENLLESLDSQGPGRRSGEMEKYVKRLTDWAARDLTAEHRDRHLIETTVNLVLYQIAAYRTALAYASLLRHEPAARLLARIVDEEEREYDAFTYLSLNPVNRPNPGNGQITFPNLP